MIYWTILDCTHRIDKSTHVEPKGIEDDYRHRLQRIGIDHVRHRDCIAYLYTSSDCEISTVTDEDGGGDLLRKNAICPTIQ
jgi:hypothetical protein